MKFIKFFSVFNLLLLFILGEVSAQNKIVTISPLRAVKDYGPIIQNGINTLIGKGGGTLKIQSGEYPVLSEIHIESTAKNLIINIEGVKSTSGKLPKLYDSDRSKKPHGFIYFGGSISSPSQKISVKNINIKGNDFPYYDKHPFYGSGAQPMAAIRFANIASSQIENVIIEDVYGDGIALMNFYDNKNDKMHRVSNSSIRNCSILNCWSWNGQNNGGDGIMLWYVNNVVVENCIILNDLNVTRHYSRAGVVIEHKSENVTLNNNTIGGYQRNIHIEGTYGGHLIQNNKLTQSANALTLNEWTWENSTPNMYAPIKFIQNTVSYTPDAKIIKRFAEFSFISGIMNGKELSNVIVDGNKFTYSSPANVSVQQRSSMKNLQLSTNSYISVIQKAGYSKMNIKTNVLN